MLKHLAIRDIVLIRKLDLSLQAGLCVLTGETGAGKSIVLDALGLALGGRADRGLVRAGAAQGTVAARFEPPVDHAVWSLLDELAIEAEGEVVLRRIVGADGRSRAFVNDEPVTGQLLRRLGDALVEVHGQHEQRALLSPGVHRELLDAFAGLEAEAAGVAAAHAAWVVAVEAAQALASQLEAVRREELELRRRADEVAALAVTVGEETELAERRHRLMNREKLAGALSESLAAIGGGSGARERLVAAERRLTRIHDLAGPIIEPTLAALGRTLVELDEVEAALEVATRDLELDADTLERVETRLFALRDAARKYRLSVDELPAFLDRTMQALGELDSSAAAWAGAVREADAAEQLYLSRAKELGKRRRTAASKLAAAVVAELPPLKLERARFRVLVETLDEADWGPAGQERIAFEVSTNPGQPFGPITRIASGGELARFMLAVKVVLARIGPAGTLVFDEVDTGIGGATADAVGERLARLAGERQVLVVTHSPQVAARATQHLAVRKRSVGAGTSVEVAALDESAREAEVARMLAGAHLTDAARSAARSLLDRAVGA